MGRATIADLEAVPAHQVAELVGGTLHVMRRPAPRHAHASSELGIELGSMFGAHGPRRGGPGGWWILDEPELRFADPTAAGEVEVVVPDLAGWRRDRMPELPEGAFFTLAPDWVCEVLSKSTEDFDRNEKMAVYAREGVKHAWLVDPVARTLEVYTLGAGRRWGKAAVHRWAERVRVAPFEAIEMEMAVLWAG